MHVANITEIDYKKVQTNEHIHCKQTYKQHTGRKNNTMTPEQ